MHHERGEFRQQKTAGPDLRTLPWVTQHGKPNGMFFGAELKTKYGKCHAAERPITRIILLYATTRSRKVCNIFRGTTKHKRMGHCTKQTRNAKDGPCDATATDVNFMEQTE